MALIIVEGVDGVGKTTFVERLQAVTNATMLHASQPKGTWREEYVDPLMRYRPGNEHVICDRWHWGELIYGPVYRGTSILDNDSFFIVDSFLNAKGAIIVYLDHEPDVILDRWAKRGESFAKPKDLPNLLDAYKRVRAMSRVPVLAMQDPSRQQLKRVLQVALAFEANTREAMERYATHR